MTTSPIIQETGMCRVCQACQEVCLCHEEICPNCNANHIAEERLDDIQADVLSGERIRCRFRFEHLT